MSRLGRAILEQSCPTWADARFARMLIISASVTWRNGFGGLEKAIIFVTSVSVSESLGVMKGSTDCSIVSMPAPYTTVA